MSPRDLLVTETREWLDRARSDLRACTALIAAGLPAEALFHAQQCAEKAMKALLTWNQVPFNLKTAVDWPQIRSTSRASSRCTKSSCHQIGEVRSS
jgi:hypothetical protein